jgi:Baseplate J-like protein
MPLASPDLDDRDFDQLVQEARSYIQAHCPTWTDFSPGDPGVVLLEACASLTETMIYRLNRVPEKAYIEFLSLLGTSLAPPAAAAVGLTFSLSRTAEQPIDIPRGTRVTTSRAEAGGEPVVFTTAHAAAIPAGATEVRSVLAHHCDLIEGELAGYGTGQPGLTVTAARPPLIGSTGDELDLIVGVEAMPTELDLRARAKDFQERAYRIWRRVDNFAETGEADPRVYMVDRMTGEIRFASAARVRSETGKLEDARALGAAPEKGREIRLWYRRGGGAAGNLLAGTLTVLKDPIAGLQVTNPAPAAGGSAAETLSNALTRGPLEMRAPWRAVTAKDFETLALSRGVAARAKAFTQAALWKFATPGTVETQLVPSVPPAERVGGRVALSQLLERQTDEALTAVRTLLEERRPLGVNCVVGWARYKSVRVQARVVAREEEDVATVRSRVLERLYNMINPLPTPLQPAGWRFGEALRVSNIYDAALRQPGVSYIDGVKLLLDEVPEAEVTTVTADPFQPETWYAGSARGFFRSVNNGDGWELIRPLTGMSVQTVAAHPFVPGLLALVTRSASGQTGSFLAISLDSGETWTEERQFAFDVECAAWISRDRVPVLFLATGAGLFELSLQPGATPLQILVSSGDQNNAFHAVAVMTDSRASALHVAVAAQARGGVYLSSQGGKGGSFRYIGLKEQDIRVLAVQREGVRGFLWAGAAAPSPGEDGPGCFSWELLTSGDPPDGWLAFSDGWNGGSCKAITFEEPAILTGSHHAGVLRLPGRRSGAKWERASLDSGLPLREAKQLFHPVEGLAAAPSGNLILAGGPKGLFRSTVTDTPLFFETCSARVFLDRVTLPPTWLFCSGEHSITVVNEIEA